MARTPFKMRSGNSTPFKQMGSSPLKQEEVFDQEKIKIQTRENPYTGKTEKRATGYDADIDDIRKAKAVVAIADDITGEAFGTRSGVSGGGSAGEVYGYSGQTMNALYGRKGIYEEKYNVGNEEGKYSSQLGEQGRDIDIAEHIIKENRAASELVTDINPTVEAESTTRGLKYDPSKKKKKTKTTSTKSKKVDYARSLLKGNK